MGWLPQAVYGWDKYTDLLAEVQRGDSGAIWRSFERSFLSSARPKTEVQRGSGGGIWEPMIVIVRPAPGTISGAKTSALRPSLG